MALIVAIVILALAGVTMLFLKWKEWTLIQHKPTPPSKAGNAGARLRLQAGALSVAEPAARIVARSSGAAPCRLRRCRHAGRDRIDTRRAAPRHPADAALGRQQRLRAGSGRCQAGARRRSAQADASFREEAVQGDSTRSLRWARAISAAGIMPATDVSRPAAGVRWIRRSAERGYAPAQYKLATLYETGHALPRDFGQAQALVMARPPRRAMSSHA